MICPFGLTQINRCRWSMHAFGLKARSGIRAFLFTIQSIQISRAQRNISERGPVIALRVLLHDLKLWRVAKKMKLDALALRCPNQKLPSTIRKRCGAEGPRSMLIAHPLPQTGTKRL